jgi:hypothetical protein
MDPIQSLPVPPHLFLITIVQEGLAKDNSGDAGLIDFHTLNPV